MNQFIEIEDIVKEKDIREVKEMTSLEQRSVDEDYSGKLKGRNISLPFSSLVNVNRKYLFNNFKLDELIFAITDVCPFRCKHCFYADTMDVKNEEAVYGMSLDEITKISASLGHFSKLLITGGEPFLRKDVAEIAKIFYTQNKIRHIHLPTNSFHTSRIVSTVTNILEECPKINFTLSISIDGLPETHNDIRGVKRSFEKLIETTRAVGELKKQYDNLRLNVITCVNSQNLNEILDLSEFVKNELPVVDGHGPIPMRGDPYDKHLRPPTTEEWDELSKELIKIQAHWNNKRNESYAKRTLRTNSEKHLYKVITKVMDGEGLPFQCKAGEVIGVLEANGDVRVCELKDTIGNVKDYDYDFKRVWFSDAANKMRETVPGCSCTHPCFINASRKIGLRSNISTVLGT
tara:strand:+ start:224 stop:1435 length:1212 start_codon:yes stop_codon:yes gene_type:complete